MALLDAVARFVGRSVYEGKTPRIGQHIRSAAVERIREILGGNISPVPITRLEWFAEEVDEAREAADRGDLTSAGQLLRALRGDSVISGLLRTKAGGCVRLPKKWSGDEALVADLTGTSIGSISNFDLLCPPSELQALAADADFLQVSLGELVPVEGRAFPVLRRRDPEFLFYNWAHGRWYYRSNAALIPIDPGDGNWVLHIAGPLTAPWQHGSWLALGRAWCRKDACQHLKSRWEFTLANPARVAKAPSGATKEQKLSHFQQVMAWGIATVFGLPPGWDVALLESKGEGWQGFDSSIKSYNEEIMIALAGQLVSITGGTGFSSEDLYASIRFDLIRDTVVPLAHTINTQILPAYVYMVHGEEALDNCPSFEFEVQRPDDLKSQAAVYTALGQGLKQIMEVARSDGIDIDVVSLLNKFGIKASRSDRQPTLKIDVAPTDLALCFTVDEIRASRNAGPMPDAEVGGMLLGKLKSKQGEEEKSGESSDKDLEGGEGAALRRVA